MKTYVDFWRFVRKLLSFVNVQRDKIQNRTSMFWNLNKYKNNAFDVKTFLQNIHNWKQYAISKFATYEFLFANVTNFVFKIFKHFNYKITSIQLYLYEFKNNTMIKIHKLKTHELTIKIETKNWTIIIILKNWVKM